jgi:hypothetical protein
LLFVPEAADVQARPPAKAYIPSREKVDKGFAWHGPKLKIRISEFQGDGSTYEVSRRIREGLQGEGFAVGDDDGDVTIYFGSFPPPSHLFARQRQLLFVHGAIEDALRRTPGERRFLLGPYWRLFRMLGSIDTFIFHSITSMEMNEGRKSSENCIILPQFILQEELSSLAPPRSRMGMAELLTYTSTVNSSRLMDLRSIVNLFMRVKSLTQRDFRATIVSPLTPSFDAGWLRTTRKLPREEYLQLLARSSLYLERCTDEEIGYGAIEAGLNGVPVAKMTLRGWGSQDYDDKTLVLADGFETLANRIAGFLEGPPDARVEYSDRMAGFLKRRRTWDAVKGPLLANLR